ncbi:hypothetical protein [Hymenobacter aerophilus]|uniref:hypothetical protein n=1 Tax=Hymenobacter aerophilus TaxID=119644 RepID=UPI000381621A|nr:hypothetical protein [Hymenobacter aerophilus]
MKYKFLPVAYVMWLVSSCSSGTGEVEQKPSQAVPTIEQTADINDWLLNSDGKLDAVSAKYNVSRDTVLKIMMGYSGMDSTQSTLLFSDLLTTKKKGPAQAITADLAKRYQLPYSTVGGMIYDMKVLELAAQDKTDE